MLDKSAGAVEKFSNNEFLDALREKGYYCMGLGAIKIHIRNSNDFLIKKVWVN